MRDPGLQAAMDEIREVSEQQAARRDAERRDRGVFWVEVIGGFGVKVYMNSYKSFEAAMTDFAEQVAKVDKAAGFRVQLTSLPVVE